MDYVCQDKPHPPSYQYYLYKIYHCDKGGGATGYVRWNHEQRGGSTTGCVRWNHEQRGKMLHSLSKFLLCTISTRYPVQETIVFFLITKGILHLLMPFDFLKRSSPSPVLQFSIYHQLSYASTFDNTVAVGEMTISVASLEKYMEISRTDPLEQIR